MVMVYKHRGRRGFLHKSCVRRLHLAFWLGTFGTFVLMFCLSPSSFILTTRALSIYAAGTKGFDLSLEVIETYTRISKTQGFQTKVAIERGCLLGNHHHGRCKPKRSGRLRYDISTGKRRRLDRSPSYSFAPIRGVIGQSKGHRKVFCNHPVCLKQVRLSYEGGIADPKKGLYPPR
jgi:hypothetical protein